MIAHNPGNIKPYDKLWAILSVDSRGNEGICAINTPIGPQVAVTGEKKILEIYLEAIKQGMGEVKTAKLEIVIAEYTRTSLKDIKVNSND